MKKRKAKHISDVEKAAAESYFFKICVATREYLDELGSSRADACERVWAVTIAAMPKAYGKRWPRLRPALVRKYGPEFDQPGYTYTVRFRQLLATHEKKRKAKPVQLTTTAGAIELEAAAAHVKKGIVSGPVATHSKALEQRMRRDEKARLDSIAELEREVAHEKDPDERANIRRTLKELRENKPLRLTPAELKLHNTFRESEDDLMREAARRVGTALAGCRASAPEVF